MEEPKNGLKKKRNEKQKWNERREPEKGLKKRKNSSHRWLPREAAATARRKGRNMEKPRGAMLSKG